MADEPTTKCYLAGKSEKEIPCEILNRQLPKIKEEKCFRKDLNGDAPGMTVSGLFCRVAPPTFIMPENGRNGMLKQAAD
jgi:hypothetical protein